MFGNDRGGEKVGRVDQGSRRERRSGKDNGKERLWRKIKVAGQK